MITLTIGTKVSKRLKKAFEIRKQIRKTQLGALRFVVISGVNRIRMI